MKRISNRLKRLGTTLALLGTLTTPAKAEPELTTSFGISYEQRSSPAIGVSIGDGGIKLGFDEFSYRFGLGGFDAEDDLIFADGSLGSYIRRFEEDTSIEDVVDIIGDITRLVKRTCNFATACDLDNPLRWELNEPIKINFQLSTAAQIKEEDLARLYGITIGMQLDADGKLHVRGQNLNNFSDPDFTFRDIASTTDIDAGIGITPHTKEEYRLEALALEALNGLTFGWGYVVGYREESRSRQTYGIQGDIALAVRPGVAEITPAFSFEEAETRRSKETQYLTPVLLFDMDESYPLPIPTRNWELPLDAIIELGVRATSTKETFKRNRKRAIVSGDYDIRDLIRTPEGLFVLEGEQGERERTEREAFGATPIYRLHGSLPIPSPQTVGLQPYATFREDGEEQRLDIGATAYTNRPFSIAADLTYRTMLTTDPFLREKPIITVHVPLGSNGRGRQAAAYLDRKRELGDSFVLGPFQQQLLEREYLQGTPLYFEGRFSDDDRFALELGGSTNGLAGKLSLTTDSGVYVFGATTIIDGVGVELQYTREFGADEDRQATKRYAVQLTLPF